MRIKKQLKTRINPIAIGISIITFGLLFVSVQNLKANNNNEEPIQKEKNEIDKRPEYPGGIEAMNQFIKGNTIYPKTMKDKGIKGKVYVQFNVLADGSLADFNAIRSPHEELTVAAIKAAKKMPNWIPGEKDGKKIKVLMTLPIDFNMPEPPKPPTPPTPPSR